MERRLNGHGVSKTFRWLTCGLIGLAVCFAIRADDLTDAVRVVLQDHIDFYQGSVGMVIGLVDEHGAKVIAYGRTSKDSGAEVNGDTEFEIGSITKTFTALLLQDMVERGEMALDDPVAKHLPASVKMPTHAGREITLQHLAQHTSGLPRDPDTEMPRRSVNDHTNYTVERLYAFLSSHTLIRDPGVKFEYSNLGMGLLGHVIALKAGTNYETLVRDRIWQPLGMASTCIRLTPELQARAAAGHDWFGNPAEAMVNPVLIGAGSIYSTANDMLKYLSANLGLTESRLTPLMQQTHAARFRIQASDGAENQGLGWVSAGDFIWHTGGTSGFTAFAGIDRKRRRGVVVLSNSSAGRGIYPLENLLLNSDWQACPRATFTPAEYSMYDAYVGHYQFATNFFLGIRRAGHRLLAEASGRMPLELLPQTQSNFLVSISGKSVTFVRDQQGKVRGLISDVNGAPAEYARISDQPPSHPTPPPAPVFVKVDGATLDAFVGRYQLPSGLSFRLNRERDHLVMLPDRRGCLELYPVSADKVCCPYFQFEVTLLQAQGKISGVTTLCPEQDFNGTASKITPPRQGAWIINHPRATAGMVVGLALAILFAHRRGRRETI